MQNKFAPLAEEGFRDILLQALIDHDDKKMLEPNYRQPDWVSRARKAIVEQPLAIPAKAEAEVGVREALETIRKYCDENLGPSRSSLLSKIAHVADAALANDRAAVVEDGK